MDKEVDSEVKLQSESHMLFSSEYQLVLYSRIKPYLTKGLKLITEQKSSYLKHDCETGWLHFHILSLK